MLKHLIKKIFFKLFKIISTSICGSVVTCADFFTLNPFAFSYTSKYSYTFQINFGYNKFILPQPALVTKGYLIYLTQTTGVIAVDQSSNSTYSDLVWNSIIWNRLNEFSNWRLYLNAITNYTSYQSQFNLLHTYSSLGIYTLTITYASSNDIFQIPVNITDSNIIIYIFNYLNYFIYRYNKF